MISNVFLQKNIRFARIFDPDLRQFRIKYVFSQLVIRIFLSFRAIVFLSTL